MVKIGQFNELKVLSLSPYGLMLDGGSEFGSILLPNKYVPTGSKPGDELRVFVYFDSEDRIVATTESPRAQVGDIALLQVVSVNNIGAFLDWGLPKDLFLPHSEQLWDVTVGSWNIVHIDTDKSMRVRASMRIEKHLQKATPADFVANQKVNLMIYDKTNLGYKALVNNKFYGLLFSNEVFKPLDYAQKTDGYVKQVREDGKLDLILTQMGHHGADDIGPEILERLKENNGFLPITDKSDPSTIYDLFGASKKKFKIALGGLYKSRLITIAEDGIRLVRTDIKK